jgi:hypothetical protein
MQRMELLSIQFNDNSHMALLPQLRNRIAAFSSRDNWENYQCWSAVNEANRARTGLHKDYLCGELP